MYLHVLHQALRSPRARSAFQRARAEFIALASALLSPGKFVAEVEAMYKLEKEATRIEARQPARAAALRRRAASLCLN